MARLITTGELELALLQTATDAASIPAGGAYDEPRIPGGAASDVPIAGIRRELASVAGGSEAISVPGSSGPDVVVFHGSAGGAAAVIHVVGGHAGAVEHPRPRIEIFGVGQVPQVPLD